MNCQQALLMLYEVLDRESSTVDTEEFKKHLEECRPCLKRYELEEVFQKFVVDKASQKSSQSDVESLKARIKSKLDGIDSNASAESSRGRFPMANRILAVAATLVLVVGAAYMGKGIYHHQDVYIPI